MYTKLKVVSLKALGKNIANQVVMCKLKYNYVDLHFKLNTSGGDFRNELSLNLLRSHPQRESTIYLLNEYYSDRVE